MPQTQGSGTVYAVGPGTNLRGPISIKRPPCAANGSITDFIGLFDANGQPQAGGMVIPSANLDPQVIQYKKVVVSSAAWLTLATPAVSLIAAPGAGKMIQLFDAAFFVTFGTAAYAAGSGVQILQGTVVVATMTAALINGVTNATTTDVFLQGVFPGLATAQHNGVLNTALTLNVVGANFTTGDSPVTVHLWYSIVTAT
jgi:hypothetical protein